MVSGKPEDRNSYQGELGGQLGFICAIEIMESMLGSTTLMVNSRNNISAPRRASIHPEAVKLLWKQVDLISCLSDAFNSIDLGMSLVHVYGHHNSDNLASTLMPI